MKTKLIILTGGVYSSLGKGIISSSIGRILSELNFKISIMKFDPYLNIDPSKISPLQHGEVFLTNDGKETDLDIGNYERFIGTDLNLYSSISSGILYQEIIQNQKDNKYEGSTIQVIPHITDLILNKIFANINSTNPDFLIIEIGGTVGDIESIPFLEALNRYVFKYGKDSIMFIHCVPLIKLSTVFGEIKTKPAQHSIYKLRSLGIVPDILFLRSDDKLDDVVLEKISNLVLIQKDKIFTSPNMENKYFLVNHLTNEGIQNKILEYFKLPIIKNDFLEWNEFTNSIKASMNSTKIIKVLIIGDYIELHDAYFSVVESINLTSFYLELKPEIEFISCNEFNKKPLSDFNKYNLIINSGSIDNILDINKLIEINKPTINYDKAFENIVLKCLGSDYLKETEFKGSRVYELKNKEIISLQETNQILERSYSKTVLIDDAINDLEKKGFTELAIFQDEIFAFSHKHHNSFIVINGLPQFTSKPNKPNWIYLYCFKKAMGVL